MDSLLLLLLASAMEDNRRKLRESFERGEVTPSDLEWLATARADGHEPLAEGGCPKCRAERLAELARPEARPEAPGVLILIRREEEEPGQLPLFFSGPEPEPEPN